MIVGEPITLMARAALVVRMKADGIYDDDFVGFLGNVNHLLLAVPDPAPRRHKPAARKRVKATA